MNETFAGALLKMGLWLAVLLGLLYLVAWAAKRFGLAGTSRGFEADSVRIVSRTAIDPRKSIIVAHVRDKLLVLGVTPSEVRLLTEMSPSESAAAAASAAGSIPRSIGAPDVSGSFASRLARALQRPASSRAAH